MRLLGLNITREKAVGQLSAIGGRGLWSAIMESFSGAWQKNVEVRLDSVLSFHAVFACQTLIASDIAKLRVKLVAQDANGLWSETKSAAYSPVLRKPNGFQNRIQFFECWVLSKLQAGNTYVLKQRDNRGVVVKLYVLDPNRVKPMVADDGSVFYELKADNLAGIGELVVPAREIIHDRFNCFFHPLVGLSPIFANGLASTQGLAIQNNSARFFQNGSQPGGILTAPGNIDQKDADRLKAHWEEKYTGANAGKIAVLGSGLKYEALTTKAVDAQLIEQLKWTSEVVCSTYHVPPYKIGIGTQPTYNNVQALNVEYYSQALQVLIESIEVCLDEGLATGETLGTEFDLDNLLRMDASTAFEVAGKAKGILKLDEVRRRVDAPPVTGGDTIYLQQQDHSLAAIAARDAQLVAAASAPPPAPAEPANDNTDAEARAALIAVMKGLA
jgi:HK97 family phage portal protein